MKSAQQSASKQIKHVNEMQAKAIKPMRIFGGLAAEVMEQVARKNYAVMGDFIDFSVKQVQLPLSRDNAKDIFTAQMEEFSAFGELMNSRASEYVELISSLSEHTRVATEDAAAQIRDVADDAAQQTKRAVDSAVVHTQQAADEVSDRTKQAVDEFSNNAKKAANDVSDNAKDAADNAKNSASASSRPKQTASREKKHA